MGRIKTALLLSASAIAIVVPLSQACAQQSVVLPTIEVIGNAPLPGSEIAADKVPSNFATMDQSQFDHAKSPNLTDAMVRALPGVSLGDQTGNPFQPDINYRGFVASPVLGTPQGIAVYQNGTRINEVFGDTINWDFIPDAAINRLSLVPNNPAYGLNALGGAVTIEMKNGFTYHGSELEARAGSFGRVGATAQVGAEKDGIAAYAIADVVHDNGWRDFSSDSQLRRTYLDFGTRGEQTEFHVSFTGADNMLGGVVATPVEMLNQRWSSVYTWPQFSHNQLAFLQANGSYRPIDSVLLQANGYYRAFRQSHTDGNTTDAQSCDPMGALAGFLCFGNGSTPLLDLGGNTVPDAFGPNLAELDRTSTRADSYGGTLQGTVTAQLFGHDNHLVFGTSLDRGFVKFDGNSELGTIDQNLFITGTGVFIQQPAADLAPVSLHTFNTYIGMYLTDTFDVTDKLSLTGGARYNIADIRLEDQLGTALDSDNAYAHLNPVVGLTYKLFPSLTAYAGYSESNRAPTPLELGCSDPAHPCLIDTFLISDPPLKQVVGHTYEAGLRGNVDFDAVKGLLKWNLGVYRTDSIDDIINEPSQISGFGFFTNAGNTRRQGVEAGAKYQQSNWSAYANFTTVDATYQSAITIASPFNPFADANGDIFVVPGNHIPGVPDYRLKVGGEYAVTEPWKVGADVNVFGPQYLIGDNSNLNPQVPAYWVVNLHSTYKVTPNVEVFGLVQNLFNQHYYVAGSFFDTQAIAQLTLTDPRTFIPGMPLAAYAGIRGKF